MKRWPTPTGPRGRTPLMKAAYRLKIPSGLLRSIRPLPSFGSATVGGAVGVHWLPLQESTWPAVGTAVETGRPRSRVTVSDGNAPERSPLAGGREGAGR